MIKIPRSREVQVEDQLKLVTEIDTFFKEVYDDVVRRFNIPKEYQIESSVSHFEIRRQTLTSRLYDGSKNSVGSDDNLKTLVYKDRVIAGVLATRTEFNHVSYAFFTNLENLEDLV